MKVVFLDIDGVLNDAITTMDLLDDKPKKEHLDCLKVIVDATDAKIILSSTWRLFPSARNDVKNALRNVGLEFIDKTKELKDRASEIQEWLSRHPEVEKFVILDDEEISGKFPDNLVQTTFYRGLLPEHVEKAIKILNS
jgi:hypothetical protein